MRMQSAAHEEKRAGAAQRLEQTDWTQWCLLQALVLLHMAHWTMPGRDNPATQAPHRWHGVWAKLV